MEYYEITKEMLLNAKTFMPLQVKQVMSDSIAQKCIRQVKVDEIAPIPNLPLPPVFEEDPEMKAVLLCSTLFGYYFDHEIEFDESEEGTGIYDAYNQHFGGHPLNQIERFKGDKDVKNIAFDLLEDWREFKKLVDTKIFNLKARKNDILSRIWNDLALLGTPENIIAFKNEIEELKTLGEKREEITDGQEQG